MKQQISETIGPNCYQIWGQHSNLLHPAQVCLKITTTALENQANVWLSYSRAFRFKVKFFFLSCLLYVVLWCSSPARAQVFWVRLYSKIIKYTPDFLLLLSDIFRTPLGFVFRDEGQNPSRQLWSFCGRNQKICVKSDDKHGSYNIIH